MHKLTYLDKNQHGTAQFPVEYYYVDSQHPRYQMAFHWHNEWELLRVLDGNMQLHLDNEQFSMQAGDVLLIPGEALHGGEPSECVYECLVFDLYGLFKAMESIKPHLRPFYRGDYTPIRLFTADSHSEIYSTATELMNVFKDGTDSCCELKTVAGIARLFSQIIAGGYFEDISSARSTLRGTSQHIKAVLEHIEANYSDALTLDGLAKIAGMNAKYFCRVFCSLTHYTPMSYVNFYRTEQAAYLLDTTDMPITAIGIECGFWESSYFTKVFKKYKKTTPQKYRAMLRTAKK